MFFRKLVFCAVLWAAFLCVMSYASAHDSAAWIQERAIKNAVGQLCCGERDCSALDDGDVSITPQGYFIKSLNETVPFHDALPLPSEEARTLGKYWRCYWGGQRKCFFAPAAGS